MSTWQYSSTGSSTCFHMVSALPWSSLDSAAPNEENVAVVGGGLPFPLREESKLTSEPALVDRKSELVLNAERSGERTGNGEAKEVMLSEPSELRDSMEMKKDVMKVYSEVALSMNTSRRDLRIASRGSFCWIL